LKMEEAYLQEKSDISSGMSRKEAKAKSKKKVSLYHHLTVCLIVLIWGLFAYRLFFAKTVSSVFLSLAVPAGISYWSLEEIGYLTDVMWKKEKAEHSFLKFFLFISFFPQLLEGPIARYSETADDIYSWNGLKDEDCVEGMVRVLRGLFRKIVIANRMASMVQPLFDHPENYNGLILLLAGPLYALWLYMDFSGSIEVVNGIACFLGVHLPVNFRRPFFAENAGEFWRRWHITLGRWFREYVFYPLSTGSLVMKWVKYARGKVSQNLTKLVTSAIVLFPVWIATGIWHGPRWTYVFYGFYYFVVLMLEQVWKLYFDSKHLPHAVWLC